MCKIELGKHASTFRACTGRPQQQGEPVNKDVCAYTVGLGTSSQEDTVQRQRASSPRSVSFRHSALPLQFTTCTGSPIAALPLHHCAYFQYETQCVAHSACLVAHLPQWHITLSVAPFATHFPTSPSPYRQVALPLWPPPHCVHRTVISFKMACPVAQC